MADYKATDTEFTAVANAIRTRGGTSGQLEWPSGFVSAIAAIPGGGVPSSVVTENLVVYYDAINNTGNGHSGSATSWKDLSGNNFNGAINNGIWQDDALVFNGESTWVNCGERNYPVVTIECFMKYDKEMQAASWQYAVSNFEGGGIFLGQRAVEGVGVGTGFAANVNGTYYYTPSDIVSYDHDNFALYTGVFDTQKVKIYKNGILMGEASVPSAGIIQNPTKNTVIALGTNPQGSTAMSSFFEGKIKSFRMYNRPLGVLEIANNYAYDLNRYS